MIEPVKTGCELQAEIDETHVDNGVALWWLGQSGFVIKTRQTIIYIDLYLSEHLSEKYKNAVNPHIRMTKAPMRGKDIFQADLILSTHKHSDHMDPQTIPDIMKNCPQALYVLPRAHFEHVIRWGVDANRLVAAKVGEPFTYRDVTIFPVPAKHEQFDYDPRTGYPHVSYIISTPGATLYHSGDTIPYDGLVQALKEHHVTTALLPVNGRDKVRHAYGTPGNCTAEEALCLCACSGIKHMIPHHYDMFTFNTVDIRSVQDEAAELYPDIHCTVLQCGERIFLGGEAT